MSEIFLHILNGSISAGWLVLAVLVLRLVLKKAPKWVSVLLWGLVAVRLVCPISFESMLSLIPSAETVSPQIMMDRTPPDFFRDSGVNGVVNPILAESFTPVRGDSANPLQIWIPVVTSLWIAGIAGMLIYTAVSYLLLKRKVSTAVRLKENIFQSEYVSSPFVLGLIRPTIFVPYGLEEENLNHVIAHENAHIARKDHWWKPLGFLLLAVHWFNPLMWVGYIFLCRDIELACDEKVIKSMNNENRADYTQALLSCSIHRRSIAACPLAFGEVGVKERVKSVMNYKKPGFWIILTAIVTCIVVAVCFLTNPIKDDNENPSNPAVECQFRALVMEVHDQYLLVEPVNGSAERNSADRIEVSLPDQTAMPKVGDEVTIVYDGQIQETYPARITNVYRIDIGYFDSGPIRTIHGNLKTYYENTDGTWQVDGRIYKYRLEISGQVKNALNPGTATFVFLSNWEHISFDQAWNGLYSNNCTDWFLVEDTALVDYRVDNVAATVKPQSQLDALISSTILKLGKNDKPDGLINTESHMILGHELVSATPALGETVHLREEAVYVYFLNAKYRVVDGKPEEVSNHFSQAIITFAVDDKGGYVLKDFLEPQYAADYHGDLLNLFASAVENAAENGQAYNDQLRQQCLKTATEYLENISAQSGRDMVPTEYHLVIDSILYDIDGDGKVDSCTLTPGPTSGLYSFCMNVNTASGNRYSCTYVLMGAYDLSFDLADDRTLRIKGQESDEVVYFDIGLEDGNLMLFCEAEDLILRSS